MMRQDPDAPGFLALLRGEGDPAMRFLARVSVVTLFPLLVAGTYTVWT